MILLVRPARFERATCGFVVRHSIQLSYGRINEMGFITHIVLFGNKFIIRSLLNFFAKIQAVLWA